MTFMCWHLLFINDLIYVYGHMSNFLKKQIMLLEYFIKITGMYHFDTSLWEKGWGTDNCKAIFIRLTKKL